MSIEFQCPGGHSLRVADAWAGRQGRCPVCREKTQVPFPGPPERTAGPEKAIDSGESPEAGSVWFEKRTEEAAGRNVEAAARAGSVLENAQEVRLATEKPANGRSLSGRIDGEEACVAVQAGSGAGIVAPKDTSPGDGNVSGRPAGPQAGRAASTRPANRSRASSSGQWIRGGRFWSHFQKLWPAKSGAAEGAGPRQWRNAFLLSGCQIGLSLFCLVPALKHWDLRAAPDWARAIWLLSLLQLAFAAWTLSAPDWATLWLATAWFTLTAALYGAGMGMVLATPHDHTILLDLADVRRQAPLWCGAIVLLSFLVAYGCGRCAWQWRREGGGRRQGAGGRREA